MKCKFCQSQKTIFVKKVNSPFINRDYTLIECSDCQNRFFSLSEHEDIEIQKIYDEHALVNSKAYKVKFEETRTWRNEVNTIKKLHQKPIANILDIGCRTGDFLLHWGKDVNCIGIEIAERSVKIARERGLVIKQDFVENVKFTDKFDVVTCYAILEHLDQPISFIKNMNTLVKNDGILVIMIPEYQSLKEKVLAWQKKRWHMYSPPEHLNFMTYQYINSLLKDDFILVKRKYTTGNMVRPFNNIPILNKIGARLMWYWDKYHIFNQYPVFDHMYLYYRKKAFKNEKM